MIVTAIYIVGIIVLIAILAVYLYCLVTDPWKGYR